MGAGWIKHGSGMYVINALILKSHSSSSNGVAARRNPEAENSTAGLGMKCRPASFSLREVYSDALRELSFPRRPDDVDDTTRFKLR